MGERFVWHVFNLAPRFSVSLAAVGELFVRGSGSIAVFATEIGLNGSSFSDVFNFTCR
jgi:hypothetical protein